jgi:hypothetical protein
MHRAPMPVGVPSYIVGPEPSPTAMASRSTAASPPAAPVLDRESSTESLDNTPHTPCSCPDGPAGCVEGDNGRPPSSPHAAPPSSGDASPNWAARWSGCPFCCGRCGGCGAGGGGGGGSSGGASVSVSALASGSGGASGDGDGLGVHPVPPGGTLHFVVRRCWSVDSVCWVGGPPSSTHRALVVGMNTYRNLASLSQSVGDAQDVGDTLRLRGYRVTLVLDCTKRLLEGEVERFAEELRPGYTVVVYFAGHGMSNGADNFLVPVDGRGGRPKGPCVVSCCAHPCTRCVWESV